MRGTTLRLPSSRGWAGIVCRDSRHYHLKLQNIFCPVIFFPAGDSNRASQDCEIQRIHTLRVISGNRKWQSRTPRPALWVRVCETSIFFFFFYPRWGVSTSHQPVFQCNYSVSVTLNASKDVHMMKTSRAISRPDYSGRVSVIKAWLSDAMGHLGIVDVLYAQVGDKWNSASTCSAWHVCTRGERHCHPLCFCRMLFLVDCTHRWEITKHPYFVTVLKQIFQVSVLNRISFLATF